MNTRRPLLKALPVLAIAFIESILFLGHWFIYRTLVVFFAGRLSLAATLVLRDALFLLAFTFVAASLLGFRFANPLVSLFYKIAAIWLGIFDFFLLAACLCRLVDSAQYLTGLHRNRPAVAILFFSLALLVSIYGLLNARWIRIRRVPIKLPNLPPSWRGRTALLFSDLHLGHINGVGFSRRIASMAARLNPDIILIPGDLFDGPGAPRTASLLPSNSFPRPSACTFPPATMTSLAALRNTQLRLLAPASAFSAMKKSPWTASRFSASPTTTPPTPTA
jgi:hypothetical protein